MVENITTTMEHSVIYLCEVELEEAPFSRYRY